MLYAFERLQEFVNTIAPTPAIVNKKNLIVEGEDFTANDNAGKVAYRDDGIFVIIDGTEYQRYIYKKSSWITKDGGFNLPKAHIFKCSSVIKWGIRNYYSASTEKVDVIDALSGKTYCKQKLDICKVCLREIRSNSKPRTTKDFFDNLDITEEEVINQETDIFGYTFDWNEISRKYRELKNYTCEQCNLKIDEGLGKRFIHVHHKNGNKKWNKSANLECLCILCHSCSDDKHLDNFQKSDMKFALETFITEYEVYIKKYNRQSLKKHILFNKIK